MRTTFSAGLLMAAFLTPLACQVAGQERDYLDPALRARVETLKRDVARAPTTSENLAPRTEVLWQWANAYSLAEGVLPVNLPLHVAQVTSTLADGLEPGVALLGAIDDYVYELRLKDERPQALGDLRFAPHEPLTANSWVTVEQIYTVGSMPMEPGGAVMLGRQLMADQGAYQSDDPTAENYISIRSSNPQARFTKTTFPLSGMHGGFRSAAPAVGFKLAGTRLRPGDTLHITYGDRSGGSRGLKIQSFSSDRLLLPVYLDLEGRGRFLTPDWPPLEVVGERVEAVRGFAPSIVKAGESFDLAVRSQDHWLNRATGRIPTYEVRLNGEPFGWIRAAEEPLRVLEDLTLEEPGVYRFTFRTDDDAIRGASNPIWVQEEPEMRIFWGETHGHSGFAEGQGSAEGFFRFGKEDARLDFLTLSEHDIWLDDFEWKTLQELTARYTEAGTFVAFLGYEWSGARQRGGHHNVFFRTPDKDRVPMQEAHRLPLLYQGLKAQNPPQDVLIIPHAHQAADWTESDPELEKLVEIYSMHGTFDWFGNLYLKNGFEVGFVGASDDHRSRPGYAHGITRAPLAQFGGLAAVLAPEKTRDTLFAALRGLAAYATSGQRIILDARLNGARMGTRQEMTPRRHLTCRVIGTAPIDRIEVIKNGTVILSRDYLATELTSHAWVQVGFESSSEVFGPDLDNPRPYRVWNGTLEVEGAEIQSVDAAGFDNVYLDKAEIDPNQAQRIVFHAETRGRRDVMLVELEGTGPGTVLTFRLDPAREYGFAPVLVRRPARIPGAEVAFRLADLKDGRLEHTFAVGRHTDSLTLQLIEPLATSSRPDLMDRELELTDLDSPQPGDYYYVRVTQLDGSRAWSSPFWVGTKQGG